MDTVGLGRPNPARGGLRSVCDLVARRWLPRLSDLPLTMYAVAGYALPSIHGLFWTILWSKLLGQF